MRRSRRPAPLALPGSELAPPPPLPHTETHSPPCTTHSIARHAALHAYSFAPPMHTLCHNSLQPPPLAAADPSARQGGLQTGRGPLRTGARGARTRKHTQNRGEGGGRQRGRARCRLHPAAAGGMACVWGWWDGRCVGGFVWGVEMVSLRFSGGGEGKGGGGGERRGGVRLFSALVPVCTPLRNQSLCSFVAVQQVFQSVHVRSIVARLVQRKLHAIHLLLLRLDLALNLCVCVCGAGGVGGRRGEEGGGMTIGRLSALPSARRAPRCTTRARLPPSIEHTQAQRPHMHVHTHSHARARAPGCAIGPAG